MVCFEAGVFLLLQEPRGQPIATEWSQTHLAVAMSCANDSHDTHSVTRVLERMDHFVLIRFSNRN